LKITPETAPPARRAASLWPRTLGYFAVIFCIGLMAAILGPTLPVLAEQTRTGLGVIGILFTARSLGSLSGALQGGRLYDRLPGHLLMAVMLAVMAGTMALVPALTVLWALIAVIFVMGLAEGALDVGANTLLVWAHGRRAAPYLNALHFFLGLGALLSPLVVGQVLAWRGEVSWAFWGLGLFMLPPAAWLFFQPLPEVQRLAQASQAGPPNRRALVLIAALFFLYVGAEVSFGGWVYTYAVQTRLSAETAAAGLTSLFWASLTLGRLVSIPLAARLAPERVLGLDLAGCLVSLGVIWLLPGSPLALWLGAAGLGFSMASFFPTTLGLAEQRMILSGRVNGWFFAASSAGAMLLPWLVGRLFERFGPQALPLALLVDLLIALFVFFLARRTPPRRAEASPA
jgi:FHS family Na+ dependent glucose MFS transporter 1